MNEVREQIADIIHKTLFFGREVSDEWIANQKSQGMPFTRERADQILSLEGIAVLDDDQSLPEIPEWMVDSTTYIRSVKGEPIEAIYTGSQQDMLKAGFKKVKQ